MNFKYIFIAILSCIGIFHLGHNALQLARWVVVQYRAPELIAERADVADTLARLKSDQQWMEHLSKTFLSDTDHISVYPSDWKSKTSVNTPAKETVYLLNNVYYSFYSSITAPETGSNKNSWKLVETADSIGIQPSEKSDPLVIEEWVILFTDKTQPVEPEIFKSFLQHLVTTHNDTVSN